MGIGLLPSALLAWPIAILFWGSSWPTESNVALAITEMALCILAVGILGAKVQTCRPKWVPVFFFGWLILQPFLMAAVGWPFVAAKLWAVIPSIALQLGVVLVPSFVFQLTMNRGLSPKKLGWLPLGIFSTAAVFVDVSQASGITSIQGSLFSIDSFGGSQPWGLVTVLLLAGWISSVIIPFWFLWCVDATRLTDSTADRIHALWNHFGTKRPEVLFWPTDCRAANAVVLNGITKKRVLLTDRLILTFTEREVDLIMLHELAHVVRRHGLVRLLPTLLAIPLLLVALTFASGVTLVAICVGITLSFVGLLVGTCWWTEWDADRQAIMMASSYFRISTQSASQEYVEVLKKLYHSNQLRKTSWSHPSLQQRLAPFCRQIQA